MSVFLAEVSPYYAPLIALPNRALPPLAATRPSKTAINVH